MEIRNNVVLVTGATAGIGRATAVALAQKGANVVITGRREARLQTLTAELSHYPGERLAIAGDLCDEAFTRQLIHQTVDHFGQIGVLINNAGFGHHSPLTKTPLADIRAIFELNVFALMTACHTAVPYMRQQGFGQIINVSSIVGQRPLVDSGAYTASKTAVNFLTRSLRMELMRENITVTLVYPGLTATEFAQARLGQTRSNRFGLKGVPPEKVAKKIVRAIERNRQEVYVTWVDWAFTHANRLFPRTLDYMLGFVSKYEQ
jgi:short-subunit dehydrogenase